MAVHGIQLTIEGESTRGGTAMPYKKDSDLPEQVKDNLPAHAQHIYKEAFNSAYEQYKSPEDRRERASREETAHKVAWSAVKKEYHKNRAGEWVTDKGHSSKSRK
jgi:cation transport regulator